jgi:stage II sporulation protein M
LLPHGIFELPALIIGEAAAFSFGTAAILALFKKERRNLLLPNLKQNLIYLLIAFALLLPAAIIETFVTPLLLA